GPHRRLVLRNDPTLGSEEFIPIGKRKKQTEIDPQDSYRSIEGEKEREDDSDIFRTESSSDESEGPGLTAEQESIKELEKKLGRNPDDESSWLKLLDISVKSIPVTAKRGARARADIAISILERAISTHPANKISLLGGMEGLSCSYWSEPWKRSIIWLSWLEWRLSSSKSISDASTHAKTTVSALSGSEYEMVRFLEQAYAIFQAQLELSDFCPKILTNLPLNDRIERLEEFWESEVPRIGEKNAAGWAVWEQRGRPEAEEEPLDSLRDLVGFSISDDPYQRWYRRESACDLIGALSTRSFNEDQDDPFTTILFNDIREFLSDIRSDNARNYLRLAFLSFNGLHIPGLSIS
ncbi:11367_t:CDS:2, partial [Acaulospora colombiana]